MDLLFGLRLHWGDPNRPTEIRAWTTAFSRKDSPWRHDYITHQVCRWYGLSRKRDWFCGFCRLGKTEMYSSPEKPRVGWPSEMSDRPSDITMGDEATAGEGRSDG
ncbi:MULTISPECIES: hypothetical protein [Methylorubrum]|uniref:hypothetical protein n=1 Tax=Methylorubrum TaxID=2282523 RepID=UPI0020A1105F|nr:MULTISPECIES: hypothetical protein [Methylorubrum]MCP1550649.1 hypothetical protein [Methylorubrum zatmanii]MCP1552738.1 hypothetical protein [Methylorubrum extorquens]MCP1580952.1 hypothetical protein [Methylorubrum extorquens]